MVTGRRRPGCAGVGWAARGFVGQVDQAGLVAQVDGLAAGLPPGAVLLFNDQAPVGAGDFWGTPLRFVYGYDVFALRETPEAVSAALVNSIESWQNMGRPVIWVGATDWLDEQDLAYTTTQVTLETKRLESSYEVKPQRIIPVTTQLMMSYIEPR